ncbi:MAG: metallophosphoesterase family protein [Planctomycetes bacterium]|nr:metallophosphoesterase family protein [Planctomycetota bacterium]
MLLGVVSDTHGRVETARAAARMLESLEVACVIHCGDVGSAEIVPLFSAWPAHFVFGNVDDDVRALRAAIAAAGQTCHERFGTLELDGRRIAFLHSDDRRKFDETVASGQWDLVCYGHTHVAEQHRAGPTLVLNPGALHRARPHSFAVVDLKDMQATHIEV